MLDPAAYLMAATVLTVALALAVRRRRARSAAVAAAARSEAVRGAELEQRLAALTAELERCCRELRAAQAVAADATRHRAEMLANLSQEIRTPMNAILGTIAACLEAEDDADQRARLHAMRTAAEPLLDVLNDVLDFANLESGRLDFEPSEFAPRELVAEVAEAFTRRASERGLAIVVRVAERVPASIVTDRARLRQVLANLLSNAVSFTERGEITISVDVDSDDRATAVLRFLVRDTGSGITRERLAELFTPFTAGAEPRARRLGGTGLGLPIAQRVVALFGGQLEVESAVGAGSAFTFTVRCAPGAAHGAEPRPLRVLLAEDNLMNQRVALSLLAGAGHSVRIANDGAECLAALESHSFDLILLDLEVPRMDGLDTAREIRARERRHGGSRVPIVALTTEAQAAGREAILAVGIDACIDKPLRPGQLERVIAEVLAPGAHGSALAGSLGGAGGARVGLDP